MLLKRYIHFCRWCVFIGHEYIYKNTNLKKRRKILKGNFNFVLVVIHYTLVKYISNSFFSYQEVEAEIKMMTYSMFFTCAFPEAGTGGPNPLENHKAIQPSINVGQSSVCQQNTIYMVFCW